MRISMVVSARRFSFPYVRPPPHSTERSAPSGAVAALGSGPYERVTHAFSFHTRSVGLRARMHVRTHARTCALRLGPFKCTCGNPIRTVRLFSSEKRLRTHGTVRFDQRAGDRLLDNFLFLLQFSFQIHFRGNHSNLTRQYLSRVKTVDS